MSNINWNELANKATVQTDSEFYKQLSELVSIDVFEVEGFIKKSEISNQDALKVLKEIHDSTKSNQQKVSVISNIEKGVGFLLQVVSKILV